MIRVGLVAAGIVVVGCGNSGSPAGSSNWALGGNSGVGSTGSSAGFPATGEGTQTGGNGGGSEAATSGGTSGIGMISTSGGAAPSDTSAVGGATSTLAPPTISDLEVEPNPNNTLSCYVSWRTDVAASSSVEFGTGQLQFRISSNEQVTEHRILVIGMRANSEYLIHAVSTSPGGASTSEGQFTTGGLPSGLPEATIMVNDTIASQTGWTLTNIMPAGTRSGFIGTQPGIIVMYDSEGFPVWYFVNGNTPDQRGDVSVQILANDNILLGPSSGEPAKEIDLAGNIVWQGPAQPQAGDTSMAPMSHHASKLDNGDYILLRDKTEGGIEGALVEEVTPDNEVVWSWNLFDHLQPDANANADWCHPNSVAVDLEKDVFYLSCRWLGVIKAQRSGEQSVVWILGTGLNGGNFSFEPSESAFSDQHAPEIHDDGTILLYNNADNGVAPGEEYHSRVLEFSLDEQNMQAKLEFEFPGSFDVDPWYKESWSTPYWGDADRLVNGNILITIGYRSQTQATHILEVRPSDGLIVWQMTLPVNVGSYQAERWSPPPLVVPY
jgi:hypothetical protein